jgi:hypothetical protein
VADKPSMPVDCRSERRHQERGRSNTTTKAPTKPVSAKRSSVTVTSNVPNQHEESAHKICTKASTKPVPG